MRHCHHTIMPGRNVVEVHRGPRLAVDDFLRILSTPEYHQNAKKILSVRFILLEKDLHNNEQLERGVGVGVLKDLFSILMDKFVLPRLSVIFANGTVYASLFGFSDSDMESELVYAGEICGIKYA